jgi:hypothetical protein
MSDSEEDEESDKKDVKINQTNSHKAEKDGSQHKS